MTTVATILNSKRDPATHGIGPDATVYDAVKLMADKQIGALLVMEAGKVVGIVTERDYARKIILMARSSKDTPVRTIMTRDVMVVRPEHTSRECMALMTAHRFRHLPVMVGDEVVGLVSMGDLVKDIISEQEFIIEQLEHYISGVKG